MHLSSVIFTVLRVGFPHFSHFFDRKNVEFQSIVEKISARHKIYPHFHILSVENFFTRSRCSISVKHTNFTDGIISVRKSDFFRQIYRFYASLQSDNCNTVFTLTIDAQTARFNKGGCLQISRNCAPQSTRTLAVNNGEFVETRAKSLIDKSVKLD